MRGRRTRGHPPTNVDDLLEPGRAVHGTAGLFRAGRPELGERVRAGRLPAVTETTAGADAARPGALSAEVRSESSAGTPPLFGPAQNQTQPRNPFGPPPSEELPYQGPPSEHVNKPIEPG
jgi:hypothetical protein